MTCYPVEDVDQSYEPYKEDRKDIILNEPLRSLNEIEDIISNNNGKIEVVRPLKQYNFTGDESITKEASLTKITRFYMDIPTDNIVNTRNIMCNTFNSYGTW